MTDDSLDRNTTAELLSSDPILRANNKESKQRSPAENFPPLTLVPEESERQLQALQLVVAPMLERDEKVLAIGEQTITAASKFLLIVTPLTALTVIAVGSPAIISEPVFQIGAALALAFSLRAPTALNGGIRFVLTNKRLLEVCRDDIRWQIKDQIKLTDIVRAQETAKGAALSLVLKNGRRSYRIDNPANVVGLINSLCQVDSTWPALISGSTTAAIFMAAIGGLTALLVSYLAIGHRTMPIDLKLERPAVQLTLPNAKVYLPPSLHKKDGAPLLIAVSMAQASPKENSLLQELCRHGHCAGATISVDGNKDEWYSDFNSQLEIVRRQYPVSDKNIFLYGYGSDGIAAYYLIDEHPDFAGLIVDQAAMTYEREPDIGPLPDNLRKPHKIVFLAAANGQEYRAMKADQATLQSHHWQTKWFDLGLADRQAGTAVYKKALQFLLPKISKRK